MIALRTESPSMASYPSPPNQDRTTEENQEIDKSSDVGSPGITELRPESAEQGRQLLIENGEGKERYLELFKVDMSVFMAFTFTTAILLWKSYSIPDIYTQTSTSWVVMNLCWSSALVLSIASVANTFLGIMIVVHQSDFLLPPVHPRHRKLHTWYKFSPTLFTTIIWYLFLIGIWAFTYLIHLGIFAQIGIATVLLFSIILSMAYLRALIVTEARFEASTVESPSCSSLQLKPQ
ncbi:hypothetical protein SCHPADRAFT_550613 [Schizopora paradoxa]|uniref:Uncharacterized protein n=1 Tax=Schizopora paradoxa TaxID=27342 RepID=A0A0H2RDC0_9AGAM|nr:hypothetical protein SCHPADRAFT_550613 [Schizopora paradoxa]